MPDNTQNLADVPKGGDLPQTDPASGEALDALFADALKKAEGTPDGPTGPTGASGAAPDPGASGTPAPDPGASGSTGATGASGAAPDPGASGTPAPVTDFEKVELPPHVKPKTVTAFDDVKRLARDKISGLEKELLDAKAKLVETEKKLGDGAITPELKKEIEELREFRRQLDVEADPSFQKFDSQATVEAESIYSRLIGAGVSKETVDKIKSLGGVTKVEWDPILAKLGSADKRFIEVKLTQIEDFAEKKKRAIADAKKNSTEFLAKRTAETESSRKVAKEQSAQTFSQLSKGVDWLKTKTPDPKANGADKAAVEAHNKLVAEANETIKEALEDDSPEMKAILTMGVVRLVKADADLATTKSELEGVKKQLAEANALIAKIQGKSTGRLSSIPSDEPAPKPGAGTLNERPADALDRLFKEAQAKLQ